MNILNWKDIDINLNKHFIIDTYVTVTPVI